MDELKAMISKGKIKVNKKDMEKETFSLKKSTLGQLDEMRADWEVTRSEGVDFIVSTFYELYRGNLEIDIEGYKEYKKELTKSEKMAKKESASKRKSRKKEVVFEDLCNDCNKINKEQLYEMETTDLRCIARELRIRHCLRHNKEELIELIWDGVPEDYKEDEIKNNSNVYSFVEYESKKKK